MKNQKIGDDVLLRSIFDTIMRIERHKASKSDPETIFDAVVFDLITIGEAINKLSNALKDKYPDVPWGKIVAHRNVLIHNYLGISAEIVWSVVDNHLPSLKNQVEIILKGLNNHG